MKFKSSAALGAALVAFMGLGAMADMASAQAIYRNVDANGKVTFSDQPAGASAAPARAGTASTGASSSSGGAINASLGYELRQIVQRYPVTLYTSEDCGPCASARSLLMTRGIPYDEKTVKTNQDLDALQRLSGQNSLPLLAIGTQQLKGFSDVEWSQYLDAAGYPKSVQLPAGYRNGAVSPLVALQPAPGAVPPSASTTPAASAPPPALPPANGPTPSNPAGIKF